MVDKRARIFFDGVDNTQQAFQSIQKNFKGFQQQVKTMSESMQVTGQLLAIEFGDRARAMFSGLIMPAMESERAMADVFKMFQPGHLESMGSSKKELLDFQHKLAMSLGKTKKEAAVALSGFADAKTLDDMKKMAEVTLKLTTAFELLDSEAMTASQTVFTQVGKDSEKAKQILDTINYVAAQTTQKPAAVLAGTLRTIDSAKAAGFTHEENIAFNATLSKVNIQPDVAMTGFQNLSRKFIETYGKMSAAQSMAIDTLGYKNQEDLNTRFVDSSIDATLDLLKRIGKLNAQSKGMGSGAAIELIGAESYRALSALVEQVPALENNLKLARDLSEAYGSIDKEFEFLSQTNLEKTKKLSATWQNFKATLGESVGPALGEVLDGLRSLIMAMDQFARNNPTITSALIGTALAGAGLAAVFGTAAFAIGGFGIAFSTAGRFMGGFFNLLRKNKNALPELAAAAKKTKDAGKETAKAFAGKVANSNSKGSAIARNANFKLPGGFKVPKPANDTLAAGAMIGAQILPWGRLAGAIGKAAYKLRHFRHLLKLTGWLTPIILGVEFVVSNPEPIIRNWDILKAGFAKNQPEIDKSMSDFSESFNTLTQDFKSLCVELDTAWQNTKAALSLGEQGQGFIADVGYVLGTAFQITVDQFQLRAKILIETVNLIRKSLNYVSGGGFRLPELRQDEREAIRLQKSEYYYNAGHAEGPKTKQQQKSQNKAEMKPQAANNSNQSQKQAALAPPINPGDLQRQAALPAQKFAANIVFTDNRTTGTVNLGKNTKEFSTTAKTGKQEISIGAA